MPGPFDSGFGLEEAATEGLVALLNGLNDEIALVEAAWEDSDRGLDELRDRDYSPVQVERIPPENFHLGHVPYLIDEKTPLSAYPNVAVVAFRAGRGSWDDGDQYAEYFGSVYAELMVKASPQEGEEVCDRRAWRTADAVNSVLTRDAGYAGLTHQMSSPPTCIVSEVFTRPENTQEGHGDEWFWQAARIEYGVTKTSPFGA